MLNILNNTSVWESVRPKVLSHEPLTRFERFALSFSSKLRRIHWKIHRFHRLTRLAITSRLPRFRRLYSEMVELSNQFLSYYEEFLSSYEEDGSFSYTDFTERFVKVMMDCFGMKEWDAEDLAFDLRRYLSDSYLDLEDIPADTERFARGVVEIADAFIYGREAYDEIDIMCTVHYGFGVDFECASRIAYLLNDRMEKAIRA